MLTKVYIGKLLPDKKSYLPVLYPNLGRQHKPGRLFLDRAYDVLKEPVAEIVERIEDCDYLLIPYDFFNIEKYSSYIRQFEQLSQEYKKKILIFDFSDYDREIKVKNSVIFRVSLYKSSKRANEIAMPPFIEDLSAFAPRSKTETITVGFSGFAKFSLKNLLPRGSRRPGLYFRRKAMSVLADQTGIQTNFISRTGYAGHKDTIGMDPELARREFIENINMSDLALAPKGDGNYSLRFYEILALGRVPLLIDTNMSLPFEDELDYDRFILRVDYTKIKALSKIVKNWWRDLSGEQFIAMQKEARETFSEYLRFDKFLTRAFAKINKSYQ